MKELNKWVDVRKKQVKEVKDEDMLITIVKDDELNSYITLKEIKKVPQPHKIYVNGRKITKLDNNYTLLEYSPIDKLYNVRIHINDKKEILEYYFDIILQREIRKIDSVDVPFFNDLYLDVALYTKNATGNGPFILLDDEKELKSALKENIIDKEEYDLAYTEADKLMKELLENKNKFVNRGLQDYYKYRKNLI